MDTDRHTAELLDLARALLLVQGAILLATTIEALIWGAIFHGGAATILLSALSTIAILAARVRLRADRRRPRRLVYVFEGITVALFAVDIVLAIALTHALPPVTALLTQLALPIVVITVLRRSTRATEPVSSGHLSALEVAS